MPERALTSIAERLGRPGCSTRWWRRSANILSEPKGSTAMTRPRLGAVDLKVIYLGRLDQAASQASRKDVSLAVTASCRLAATTEKKFNSISGRIGKSVCTICWKRLNIAMHF